MIFNVWSADRPHDRQRWEAAWRTMSEPDIFSHPAYVALYASDGVEPLCACAETQSHTVLFPFLLRDVSRLGYASDAGPLRDVVTPYGYGGAYTDQGGGAVAAEFWSALDDWYASRGVVSEVVRFSLFPDGLLPYPGDVEIRSQNVIRDLCLDEEQLWREVEHKVRKNVNRARHSGVRIEVDTSGKRLDEFLAVYYGTMERRGADAGYWWPRSYFEGICRDLPGQFAFVHAVYQQRVISSELVLVSTSRVYSFLGGTAAESFHLRPNDLIKFEIMSWARSQGKRFFVLGGGHKNEDGILRYKLSFAPHGATPFRLGTRILRPADYCNLIQLRSTWERSQGNAWSPDPHFFPAYRG